MTDDSIDGIYETLTTCAKISKAAGGIGLNVHNIRASGSYIAGVSIIFFCDSLVDCLYHQSFTDSFKRRDPIQV